jgi:ribokinase
MSTVSAVINEAYKRKIPVILNPAPAAVLDDHSLAKISILTPNEIEASMLTGVEVTDIDSAKTACLLLQQKGIGTIVLTMGSKGALICLQDEFVHVPAPVVDAIDTTAAGDVFSGALASGMSRGLNIIEAVEFACKAASVSVTRMGAQQSVPYLIELQ